MIKVKKEDNWMPYPLRYKEDKSDTKGLFIATAIFGSCYLMFIAIIGLKLGFM